MKRKGNWNSPSPKNNLNIGALVAAFAILGLAVYFVVGNHDGFVVKPATGTAQAMAAAGEK